MLQCYTNRIPRQSYECTLSLKCPIICPPFVLFFEGAQKEVQEDRSNPALGQEVAECLTEEVADATN